MKITIPELALVVLIGPSGAGKSTFALRHFKSTEVLSSDFCRGLVCDDEGSLPASKDAFDVLHYIAAKRLAAAKLTVVDATNVQPESRKPLVALARQFHCLPVAIVLDLPSRLCAERNRGRPNRNFGEHVVRQHSQQLRRSLRGLEREGFRHVFVLRDLEQVDAVEVVREPLWNNLRDEHGPFDIIGDVHGCFDELIELLAGLGYEVVDHNQGGDQAIVTLNIEPRFGVTHPAGRKLVFVGDLVDRGPRIPDVLALVMDAVAQGVALCVPGNHDMKLMRFLKGRDVQITHGLEDSAAQLSDTPDEFRQRVSAFIDDLVSHYVLDDGKLVVAHAGLKEELQGRGSGAVREFCLFGETTGETDDFGLPVRHNWAAEYRGRAMVVYGHTPVPEPEWLNNTINIDTGCVFGGRLTALRYPERELVSVAARHTYVQPRRPFLEPASAAPALTSQQQLDDVLDLGDLLGKRIINTRLSGNVTIREENGLAALEVLSRFAADPKWLICLPPTMSPCETSARPDLLEYPDEAFAYFRNAGVAHVICEEKHMGSRAVVVVCRDSQAARTRFGIEEESAGIVYTRTGRRFFDDPKTEQDLLERLRTAIAAAGLWMELNTDWLCLDCELMPWSAKAQALLREQYAAVGAAARVGLAATTVALRTAVAAGAPASELLGSFEDRRLRAERFVGAYGGYCWSVSGIDDLKLAPFHLLASEGAVHIGRDHRWHMETLARLSGSDPVLVATPFRVVDVTNDAETTAAAAWWEERTAAGGEGMVVKPLEFVVRGGRGLVQPAVKCRGREYLRIIYGPDYDARGNLERLRARGLGGKRSLAIREFALGIEGLERFVRREPLRRVHECVFGVLALESEPVDPRL